MVTSSIFSHLYRCQRQLFHFKYCGKIKGRLNFFGGLIGPLNGN
jgi:hypothetical protein